MVDGTGVRVLAGERSLDRAVRWVHISEIADPTPWLSGGEVLLTTGMAIADGGRGYVQQIAAHGLAGLGVGTGVGGLEVVPPGMVEEAEGLGFPLFEVPYEVPFIAITEKAFTHIVNEQAGILQRGIAAHEKLERIALSERGLPAIVAALATLIEGAAAVLDARGEVLAASGTPVDRAVRLPVGPDERTPEAFLVGARDGAPLTELDRLILHHAVTVVAL